jgi:hypothetical protein
VPDLSIGITQVLVTAQDIVPGPKISTLAEKAVVFPLPLLGQPGATRLAPCLAGRRLADGKVTIGQPGLVSAEPKTALTAAFPAR